MDDLGLGDALAEEVSVSLGDVREDGSDVLAGAAVLQSPLAPP